MKIKRLLVWLALLVALVGCSPDGSYVRSNPLNTASQVIQAVVVAESNNTRVYRFMDGVTYCYFTENKSLHTASGIWCQ